MRFFASSTIPRFRPLTPNETNMKTKIIPALVEPGFKPVTLALTFETKAELDAFACMFNHADIARVFETLSGGKDSLLLAEGASAAGADMHTGIGSIASILKIPR